MSIPVIRLRFSPTAPKLRARVYPGIPPLQAAFRNNGTSIQWRVGASGAWTDIATLDSITGPVAAIVPGTGIAVDNTDVSHPIVSLGDQADARNYLDTAVYVASRTLLKAIDTTKESVAYLTEAGHEGTFLFKAGDYAARVTADTGELSYIKADDTATSAGAWVRTNGYPFSLDVASTGRFGIYNAGGFFSYQDVTTAGADQGAAIRAQASFSYSAGTPGIVVTTESVVTTVSAGVADYVWGLLSRLDNSATGGQNTAFYGQATKKSGAGPTWAGVFEAIDDSGNADPSSGQVSFELDVAANGTDASNNRLGLHLVGRRYDTGGAAVEFGDAIRIDSSASSSKFKRGINFFTGSAIGTGIDLSGATISGKAIQLADAQKIALDTAGAHNLSFSAASVANLDVADAATATSTAGLRLTHSTSGTAAASFGVKLEAELENGSGSNVVSGSLDFAWGSATAAAERSQLNVNLMTAGALAQVARFDGRGRLGVGVNPTTQLDVAGTGDTQLRLVDGATVDMRVNASISSGAGFIGTASAHDVIFQRNTTALARLGASAFAPNASDGLALGTTAAMWSDLFLALGAVQNFNNGDFTLTHSAGKLTASGELLSSGATSGIGYATGAGGAVTQATSKATGVTLDKVTGQVTLNNSSLAAAVKASFVVTNSTVAATDGVIVWVASGGTANAYRAEVTAVAPGSFTVTVENITVGLLSEAPVIGFAVIKGVTS